MKPYIKLYLDTFGYDVNDWIKCEIPECGKRSQDIHHVECRGMGGTKKPEDITNLVALCREHHIEFGDKKQFKEYLTTIHMRNLSNLI